MTTAIIIPVFNQWAYTEQCLDSLASTVGKDLKIIVVDNHSTDETAVRLRSRVNIGVITNPTNMGFARACNQGITETPGVAWRIFLNNDVVLSNNWLTGLLNTAESAKIDIISPAMREGPLNYAFEERAAFVRERMGQCLRQGMAHGVCFAVRQNVFETIGLFDEAFRVGQYEEADLFRRARQAGFTIATTGGSFIHHYSSVTQKAVAKTPIGPYEKENRAYYRRKWNLHWLKRKIEKILEGQRLQSYITAEEKLANSRLIDRSS
jgi:N-acetylglucosaminyl-diphospho-decaprenol L-rhamnosyltransferase